MAPRWYHRPLMVGDVGPDVVVVQRKLRLTQSGRFTVELAAVVRGYQHFYGIPASGYVDEETAGVLGQEAGHALAPPWYKGQPLSDGAPGWGFVLELLGVLPHEAVDAVKRFQGNHGLPVTGVVDEETARWLEQTGERRT